MFRCCLVVLVATLSFAVAQDKAPIKPEYKYGHDLRVRNVGAKNFDATTPKVGVEFFHDTAANALVAITEAGHLAVTAVPTTNPAAKAEWLAAFELMARPAGVAKFSEAKKFAGESFKDTGSGKLLTVTNLKGVALADLAGQIDAGKDPAWHHALELKVRAPGAEDFKTAKPIAVEAYRDGLTGGLVYVSEAGFITFAPAPAKAPEPDAVMAPKALGGLALQCRKGDEGSFTKDTQVFGVEAFSDPNSGALIYISQTGSLAALPGGEAKKGAGIEWHHSFNLRPRKAGEKDFDKAAKFGIEVFEDKNTGAWIFICENGSIAALRK